GWQPGSAVRLLPSFLGWALAGGVAPPAAPLPAASEYRFSCQRRRGARCCLSHCPAWGGIRADTAGQPGKRVAIPQDAEPDGTWTDRYSCYGSLSFWDGGTA